MASNPYTQEQDQSFINEVNETFVKQKQAFRALPYPAIEQRVEMLNKLKQAVLAEQDALLAAVNEDFGCRAYGDTKMGDLMPVLAAIDYTLKNIRKWTKNSKRHVSVLFQPASAFVMYQPLGVVGIITPWNYPLFLSLGPLVTALAAGNRVMIKMSEFTPATNKVLKVLLAKCFDDDYVSLVGGGAAVAQHFSQQAFDHLLFTGSTNVGKLVMAEAAKNLTPVTLELGGKSPTLIAADMKMSDAVSRFILGKTLNAGQTCVAPDYILCPANKVDDLIAATKKWFNKMYPKLATNEDYTAIINQGQLSRLQQWLEDATAKGAKVITLGDASSDELSEQLNEQGKMPLTIVTNVTDEMTLMQDEIFGPILPIVPYNSIEQAIDYINDRPRPLALYLLSHDAELQERVLQQTHAGGVSLNDAAMHVAQDDLPFGGIGPSGMGHYHGHEGFLTFSKAKSVYKKGKFNAATQAFPPYGKFIHKLMDKFVFKQS